MVNVSNSKKVLFRLHEDMKRDFSLALVKQGIGAQHVLEAFIERLVSYDKKEVLDTKAKNFIISTISRAKELQAESKIG